jgi:ADP-heptose:LPS heptosyltransferase
MSFSGIVKLIDNTAAWMSCDSFLPHLCNAYNLKPGVVVWGKSDPKIFGYDKNINLVRDERCFRNSQFEPWENEQHDHRVFVRPNVVTNAVLSLL